ncbi:helix-turn-helix domain-containing protein [Halalkalibacter lacteus]
MALYCIENGKDYQKATETYEVSYQQVYQWVKKYEMVEMKHLEINVEEIK